MAVLTPQNNGQRQHPDSGCAFAASPYAADRRTDTQITLRLDPDDHPLVWVPLLGVASLEEIEEEHLGRLIGLDEAADLDFKRATYGNSEADNKELAYDIADRANDVGGLIVIGVEEENGRATTLTPIPPDPHGDEEALRIHKVVGSRTFSGIRGGSGQGGAG